MGLNNIIERFQKWDNKKKIAAILLLVGAISTIVLLISWATTPPYSVLFSNLQQEDAGLIIQKLQEMKVPFKARPEGILVPADRVYELRLQLAGMGLPQGGGVGYEIFDRTGLSTTEFVQKVNYKRALQGELARTIRSLREVKDCRIHLSIPEKSIFTTEEERPKASVLLKLLPGRRLTQKQVEGIVHLVASSVNGLETGDVTVVDQSGNILTTKEDEIAMLSNSQIEYQRNLERDIERRVVGILEPVVGKEKVRAKASVTVDFTRKEETLEQYDPDGQVVRSQQNSLEQKITPTNSGVPGVKSNLPGKRASKKGSTGGIRKKTEVLNYEISKVVSHVVRPTGTLKRLTLAVIVDGNYHKDEKTGKSVFEPRSAEELKKYEEIVKKAVGFSAERGDAIQVLSLPFKQTSTPAEVEAAGGFDYERYIIPAIRYGTITLLALLAFLFFIRPLIKQLSVKPVPVRVTATGGQAPTPEIEGGKIQRAITQEEKKDEVIEWARQHPEQAALLIKQWVEEEES
ncbi:MAG: flagellar M-ring protein FliF [Nitrospirae bacterium]|nr:MAG: flagellar M-ring protein FliF [Nitrospirota bacterium]